MGNVVFADQSDWTQVVGANAAVGAGFGNPNNLMIGHLISHDGKQFAAAYNDQSGTEIWMSHTGLDWTLMYAGDFGATDPRLNSFVSFQSFLYAAPRSSAGLCIWRSSDGSNWAPVDGPCSGPQSTNEAVLSMLVFDGFLYATTENSSGAGGGEIWRTSDGVNWTAVAVGGMGYSGNTALYNLTEFQGNLYVTNEGSGIWRSGNGTDWTEVCGSCFSGGYCCVEILESFKGSLYAGLSFDGLSGFNIWSSADGLNWTEGAFEPSFKLTAAGHRLYSSNFDWEILTSVNGTDFEPDNDPEFGNPNNWYYDVLSAIDDGYLYAGTRNLTEGFELWRRPIILFDDDFETGDLSAWSGF